jgi:hypothetical protein
MRTHQSLARDGVVSIWIGDFGSEDELLDYVDEGHFASDFDFELNPRAGRELAADAHPAPISKLVEGFSYWKRFSKACIEMAIEHGYNEARCMLVVYNLEYRATAPERNDSPLKYLGTFGYSETEL